MTDRAGGAASSTAVEPHDTSAWIATEGGVVHLACGTQRSCHDLGKRHVDARVATEFYLAECCETTSAACAFDIFGDVDDLDQRVIIACALARAEGRDIGQPYRCAVHGALTFGGCCE